MDKETEREIGQDDPLREARGITYAIIGAIIIWAGIFLYIRWLVT